MIRSIKGRVSPALVISVVALFLAAGGTSFAESQVAFVAKTLGLNKAQKKQVKAIADSEIANKAPTLSVLSAANATNATNAANATNATKATSATNATNAANATNATNATKATSAGLASNAEKLGGLPASKYLQESITVYTSTNVPNGSFSTAVAECPRGYQAVGGGVDDANVLHMEVTASGPTSAGIAEVGPGEFEEQQLRPNEFSNGQHGPAGGWWGAAKNETGGTAALKVVVICAV
jgi:hypothetical protein